MGFLVLALSVGGQLLVSHADATPRWCPIASEPGLAERVIQHLKPTVRAHGVAQRVALAVLGAVLHSRCS